MRESIKEALAEWIGPGNRRAWTVVSSLLAVAWEEGKKAGENFERARWDDTYYVAPRPALDVVNPYEVDRDQTVMSRMHPSHDWRLLMGIAHVTVNGARKRVPLVCRNCLCLDLDMAAIEECDRVVAPAGEEVVENGGR